MPKTENAFALKNFDVEHILQRPFFLHRLGVMHEDTDINILDLYNVVNIAHLGIGKMEKKVTDLRRIKIVTEDYAKFLTAHESNKICKLGLRYANKFTETVNPIFKKRFEYAHSLQDAYGIAIKLVCKLIEQISNLERENEKAIQRQYREKFAANLRNIRLERKMTQRELATRLDIAVPSLSQYENAIIEPTLKNLARLADILNTSTDTLLGRTC